jgi:PIN domain nuclease of toxin-antitoxin system
VRLLLDTNALLWWFRDDRSLSGKARRAITSVDNQLFVSTAVGWELSIKNNSKKLDAAGLLSDFESKLSEEGMIALPISMDHAVRAGSLPGHHKDPFDRMIVAQAQAENLGVISSDTIFERYGVRRVW